VALPTLEVKDRAAWRAWLRRHHRTSPGVWFVFHKRSSGRSGLSYEDAVEEALCHGWIDSLVKRLDETRYLQKFTPRRPGSSWSEPNIRRVRRLARAGLMTPAGLAVFDPSNRAAPAAVTAGAPAPETPPPFVRKALKGNPEARRNFEALPPSHRRLYVRWVCAARREETRLRRLAEMLERLARGEKLGMK
jgi:uncharacterized protein YdeI (YjbR/CyaY-like superfamily)